jgi:hypothetical protein
MHANAAPKAAWFLAINTMLIKMLDALISTCVDVMEDFCTLPSKLPLSPEAFRKMAPDPKRRPQP